MESFNLFIVNQVLKESIPPTIENGEIILEINGKSYIESVFDEDSQFSEVDILFLKSVVDCIENGDEIDVNIIHNAPIFKLWYLLTHEKYFVKNIKLDKYDRIGFDNVSEPFKKILIVPIADILSELIRKYFNVFSKSETKVYLTCDYDHLNIWDVWGVKQFIREILMSLKIGFFRKSIYSFFSFFLSRFFKRFNRYLNADAFILNNKAENIAFFIPENLNTNFDGFINYSNKPVRSFISYLKQNNVQIGLHTSFNTMDDYNSIYTQTDKMNLLFQMKPKYNRHHYLRFKFTSYLEALEKVQIKKDFSLYFPESLVFRCGMSSPFYVWDFQSNKPFDTELVPTTLMDGTFSDYLMANYQDSLRLCKQKLDLSIKYGSTVVLLWHNSCLNKYYRQNNFHPLLYGQLIDYLKEKNLLH